MEACQRVIHARRGAPLGGRVCGRRVVSGLFCRKHTPEALARRRKENKERHQRLKTAPNDAARPYLAIGPPPDALCAVHFGRNLQSD